MRRQRIPQHRPKPGIFAPFLAIERQKPVSSGYAREVRGRLEAVQTRIFMGTGDDKDFSFVATYLLYGYVLAENFENLAPERFRSSIETLCRLKSDLARDGTADRERLSDVSRDVDCAVEMVLSLTVGEQEKLRLFIREKGKAMLDVMQASAKKAWLAARTESRLVPEENQKENSRHAA